MANGRMGCPYYWCSAIVTTGSVIESNDHLTTRQIIKLHEIRHPALTGTCPASLMDYPLTDHAHELLEEMRRNDDERVRVWSDQSAERRYQPRSRSQPDSQSLRGPHRLGREPVTGDDEEDWVLGGRQDEDIIPQGQDRRGVVPPTVHGEQLGRGTGMASIEEIIGMMHAAAAHVGEAIAAAQDAENQLQVAVASLEETAGIVAQVRGTVQSGLLNSYVHGLNDGSEKVQVAATNIRESRQSLEGALEAGEQFINIQYS
jgi:hypothetical protein